MHTPSAAPAMAVSLVTGGLYPGRLGPRGGGLHPGRLGCREGGVFEPLGTLCVENLCIRRGLHDKRLQVYKFTYV